MKRSICGYFTGVSCDETQVRQFTTCSLACSTRQLAHDGLVGMSTLGVKVPTRAFDSSVVVTTIGVYYDWLMSVRRDKVLELSAYGEGSIETQLIHGMTHKVLVGREWSQYGTPCQGKVSSRPSRVSLDERQEIVVARRISVHT